jgi:hypothetical protein
MTSKARAARQVTRLPAPPDLEFDDRVNDLGWLSRGPSRRARATATRELSHLFLGEDEESGLPPDPQAPPLPEPPPLEFPDTERKGGGSGPTARRMRS